MSLQEVPRATWRGELDRFSRQHEGWLVSLTTCDADGRIHVHARDVRLNGVTQSSSESSNVTVQVSGDHGQLAHEVRDVAAVKIDISPEHLRRAIVFESADGTSTNVIFRSPRAPERAEGQRVEPHHDPASAADSISR